MKTHIWLDEILSKIKPAVQRDDDDWNSRVFQQFCILSKSQSDHQAKQRRQVLDCLSFICFCLRYSSLQESDAKTRGQGEKRFGEKWWRAVFNKWWNYIAIVDQQELRPLPALLFQDDPASTSCKVDFWSSALKYCWPSDEFFAFLLPRWGV